MKYLWPILLLVTCCFAQQRSIDVTGFQNFGGRRKWVSCSTNQGGLVHVEIKCEAPWMGSCLPHPPLLDKKSMRQVAPFNDQYHQVYEFDARFLGNHFVKFDFWRVGKTYQGTIDCKEKL